ncbi:MAG: ThiF family adenylyltransferase [Bacteroidota bacterium]
MTKEKIIDYISRTDQVTFLREIDLPKQKKETYWLCILACQFQVEDHKVPINICVPKKFPYHLPKFLLPKYDHLGFLPHIEPNGSICYLEKESIFINIDKPEVVFQASAELAIQTLKDGLDGTNQEDFREEFNAFWNGNKFMQPIPFLSLIEIKDAPQKIQILKDNQKGIVFNYGENIAIRKKHFFKQSSPSQKSGLYIPLELKSPIHPPTYDERWSVQQFTNWLKPKVSTKNWEAITIILSGKKPTRFQYIIFGIPRKTGMTLLAGVQLIPKKDKEHPFLSASSDWSLKLFHVTRLDKEAILPRSGASIDLQKKKALIIGCGSVGSHLAIMLAKAGIGSLSLVDADELKYENVHRYAIGMQYSGKKKVEALKEYLSANLLYTKVTTYPNSIENLMDGTELNIDQHNLVISAVGDPTVNFLLCQQKWKIPFVIGWNEALGIGGHAVIRFPEKEGCYRCLFRNGYNIASFAAKEQPKPFHKKHLGCGEVFTPYTALDSIRTSELMARLSINYLKNKLDKAQILSWKGDTLDFCQQGFQLSNRYLRQSQVDMNNNKYNFINPNCPYCKKAI